MASFQEKHNSLADSGLHLHPLEILTRPTFLASLGSLKQYSGWPHRRKSSHGVRLAAILNCTTEVQNYRKMQTGTQYQLKMNYNDIYIPELYMEKE